MARQPVHLEVLAKGKSYGRQRVWEGVRELREYSLYELKNHAHPISPSICQDYNRCLYLGGFLKKTILGARGVGRIVRFKLTKDVGFIAPRLNKKGELLPDTGQQRMWRSMKMLKAFTVNELLLHTNIIGEAVKNNTAEDYLGHLVKAQYVTRIQNIFRLVKNTGGAAPMVQRTKVLFDPNLGKAICLEALKD